MAHVLPVAPASEEIDIVKEWYERHMRGARGEDGVMVIDPPTTVRGKERGPGFAWGLGPFQIKGSIEGLSASILAAVNVPLFGQVELLKVAGDLAKGDVEGGFNVFAASGTVRLSLRQGNELWLNVEVNSPFFPAIKVETKVININ